MYSNGTMKTEKKKLHGGRRRACHDTYQGNKYSFSVGELGLRNMYTKYGFENIVDRVAIDILKHRKTFFFVLWPSDSFCGTFDVTCFNNICENCIAPVSCNPR